MKTLTIGFIGLGSMGKPMVQNLVKAGYTVAVNDANPAAAADLTDERIQVVSSPAEVAKLATVIITMLPTSGIVEQVLKEKGGVFSAIQAGTTIIEMSSGDPVATQRLALEAQKNGAQLVDAPVSGGVTRAISGDLAIMFGGNEESFKQVEPILRPMGSSVTRTGGVGSAHAMKALNNLVSAGGFLIGVEAILLGKRFGLDPEMMVDVLNASTGMNNSTQKKFKQFVLSGKYNAGFGLDLMVKDLGIALSLDTEATARLSQLCFKIWSEAGESLGRGADHTEMAKYVSQQSGIALS